MVTKINEAEHSQLVAELRQRIAELEIRNQEYQTATQLDSHQSAQVSSVSEETATASTEVSMLCVKHDAGEQEIWGH